MARRCLCRLHIRRHARTARLRIGLHSGRGEVKRDDLLQCTELLTALLRSLGVAPSPALGVALLALGAAGSLRRARVRARRWRQRCLLLNDGGVVRRVGVLECQAPRLGEYLQTEEASKPQI
eukprot:6181757-Prymnesium_polylepis.1